MSREIRFESNDLCILYATFRIHVFKKEKKKKKEGKKKTSPLFSLQRALLGLLEACELFMKVRNFFSFFFVSLEIFHFTFFR